MIIVRTVFQGTFGMGGELAARVVADHGRFAGEMRTHTRA